MNLSQQNQHSNPITEAAKAAFPYSVPMIAGFLFLGIAYGIYMKALGFGFLYPTLMALLIYAGSVEFIAAGALIAPFSPISVLLITLMISARQIFYGISMLEKYGIHIGKKRWYLITTLIFAYLLGTWRSNGEFIWYCFTF